MGISGDFEKHIFNSLHTMPSVELSHRCGHQQRIVVRKVIIIEVDNCSMQYDMVMCVYDYLLLEIGFHSICLQSKSRLT